mmetsp:Transcript_66999/g.160543  ORF Transcript_66999/g.160543 Transcript_66999/m.160543 type:complete len:532 (+) Transcript_66999:52-1647(+)
MLKVAGDKTQGGVRPPLLGEKKPSLARQGSSAHDFTEGPSLSQLYRSIFVLFVSIFFARLAWIGMKLTDTALLGHSGTVFLSASSLADFYTQATGVFVTDKVLGSLCGQAYGAKNYDLVGVWTQVATTVFTWMLIPVMISWFLTGFVLRNFLGTEETIAGYANYYAVVLALCLPARMISDKVSSFFYAQTITQPGMVTTIMGVLLNLAFGMQLVLGIPFESLGSYGFWACPAVTTAVEWAVVAVLLGFYCGVLRYHDKCWTSAVREWSPIRDMFIAPVLSLFTPTSFPYYMDNIRPRLREYVVLSLPATLALGSDFWRFSAIGLMASWMGDVEVATFNASYRFAWMNLVVIGSFSSAAVTQLGIALGTGDGKIARRIVKFGITTVGSFLALSTLLTVVFIEDLGRIFSNDPEVLELFVASRYEMGFMIFFMCFAMHFELILLSLQRSDLVFKAAVVGSWGGQVPAVFGLLVFVSKTLANIYIGVGLGYVLVCFLYWVPIFYVDFDAEAAKAAEKNKTKGGDEDPLKEHLMD